MKNSKMKLLVFTFIVAIIMLSLTVFAANEDVVIVNKTNNDYMIYVDSYLNKQFSFAFSNDQTQPTPGDFINNAGKDSLDQNANSIVYVDNTLYTTHFAGQSHVYLWINDGATIKGPIELDLSDSITDDDVTLVNETTNKISVKTDGKTTNEETIDGVKITKTKGNIEITDDVTASYKYLLIKLPNASYDRFVKIIEDLAAADAQSNLYDRLALAKEYVTLYNSLLPTTGWVSIGTDNLIPQPEDSKTGDKFIVWIAKDQNSTRIVDLQYMEAYAEESEEYVTETVVTNKTSTLPITYDSIILFVILAVIIVAMVIVYVKMRNAGKGKHTKV